MYNNSKNLNCKGPTNFFKCFPSLFKRKMCTIITGHPI